MPDLDKKAQETMEEARVVLPGMQALFGFQLIVVFNQKFAGLPVQEQMAHLTATVLVALAIALIMTPAAYHRQVEPEKATPFFVNLASALIALAMLPLMVALSVEVYLLARVILTDVRLSAAIAGALLATFAALWFVFPWIMRWRQKPDV